MKQLAVIPGQTFGGAHNQLARLAEPLRARGIESEAAVPREADEAVTNRLADAGVVAHRIALSRPRAVPDPRLNLRFARSIRRESRALRELCRTAGADVLVAHGLTCLHPALARRDAGSPGLVWQILDSRTPTPIRRPLVTYAAARADQLVCWGERLAAEHPPAGRSGAPLTIVYPPVDTGSFQPDPARRAQGRARLGVTDGEILIGTLGVITPQKDHVRFARLIASLRARRPGPPAIAGVILGAPSSAHPGHVAAVHEAAASAGERANGEPAVTVLDPGNDVRDLLAALDVFVLAAPRRSEGMPTAILEAMASGVPVVATDVGSVGELVGSGAGLLVGAEDDPALERTLLELCTDAGERDRIGRAGRERAAAEFGLDRLADIHDAVLREGASLSRGSAR